MERVPPPGDKGINFMQLSLVPFATASGQCRCWVFCWKTAVEISGRVIRVRCRKPRGVSIWEPHRFYPLLDWKTYSACWLLETYLETYLFLFNETCFLLILTRQISYKLISLCNKIWVMSCPWGFDCRTLFVGYHNHRNGLFSAVKICLGSGEFFFWKVSFFAAKRYKKV